ncbi:hypothetical protein [Acidipila sp. EB88]|uniref:hypothetical protein n=1 Tax=Acidipila sp. EB88 TaxID=2305226 RepID=UPI001F358252|nr:hypothetical protein [Acidipila sp. EB88]
MSQCTDPVVGDILSSWRYDISGSSPAVRGDLEEHFAECRQCRNRLRLHRTIDVTLIGVATLSILAFLLAIAVIHQVEPLRTWAIALPMHRLSFAVTLQEIAVAGLFASVVAWLLIALMTPAPVFLSEVASAQARVMRNRGPRKIA